MSIKCEFIGKARGLLYCIGMAVIFLTTTDTVLIRVPTEPENYIIKSLMSCEFFRLPKRASSCYLISVLRKK
jgi:hypothetical protein